MMHPDRTHPILRLLRVAACCLAWAAAVSGCGGGGVGSGGTGGFASGPITGFGSVVVGGVRFDDSVAQVEDLDGVRRSSDDLRLGMTVEVESSAITTDASGASARASRIRFESELVGLVGTVDAAGGSFTLLGQRVRTDGLTVFEGGTFEALLGQKVEVSGLRSGPADLYASWIRVSAEAPPAIVPVEVVGTVSSLDTTARRFAVGTQAVDYAGMAPASVPGGLANGASVRVTGNVPAAGGTVTATAITVVDAPLPGQNAQRVELEGFLEPAHRLFRFLSYRNQDALIFPCEMQCGPEHSERIEAVEAVAPLWRQLWHRLVAQGQIYGIFLTL